MKQVQGLAGTGRWRLYRKEADASSGHHLAQVKAPREDIPPSAPQVLGHRLQLGLWGSVPVSPQASFQTPLFIPEGSCPHAHTGSARPSGTSASNRSNLKAVKAIPADHPMPTCPVSTSRPSPLTSQQPERTVLSSLSHEWKNMGSREQLSQGYAVSQLDSLLLGHRAATGEGPGWSPVLPGSSLAALCPRLCLKLSAVR